MDWQNGDFLAWHLPLKTILIKHLLLTFTQPIIFIHRQFKKLGNAEGH
jgi:hypothetical protein